LPFLNPVDVAEQVATMDHLCKGRFVLGVGLGCRQAEMAGISGRLARRRAAREASRGGLCPTPAGRSTTHERGVPRSSRSSHTRAISLLATPRRARAPTPVASGSSRGCCP
jgi:alkanesulfonate monooxygenase SsuD/methylene tetrahydromethanopterin reductase-like flavin-dependent oxidoreductase (luciferase family)